jgi:CheY-like chemotaxis protein
VSISGYGQEEYRRRSREAGCDFHLLKPVDPEDLHQLLELCKHGCPVVAASLRKDAGEVL